jgi:hypothetical protein
VLVLLGWIANRLPLAQLHPMSIPMAPSSAAVVLLIASGLVAPTRFPESRFARRWARGTSSVALGVSLLLFLQFLTGINLNLEHLIVSTPDATGPIPIGHMSPITAVVSMLVAGGLLTLASPVGSIGQRRVSSLLAGSGTGISFTMVLGYAYGTPLLYGSSVIPVALPTAVSLFVVGVGVLAAAGPSAWPMSTVDDDSVGARLLGVLLPAIVLLLIGEGWVETALLSRGGGNPALTVAVMVLGSLVVFSAVVTAITRRTSATIEQAQSALRLSEVRYRIVTDTARDAIVSADRTETSSSGTGLPS